MDIKKALKKVWYFIWEDNSILSWAVNIALAFLLIKFIVYPGLGFILGTTHPIVAVVTGSMEHDQPFDKWWEANKAYYENTGITKKTFEDFPMKNGFNKGDIIMLRSAKNTKVGEIIVFKSKRPDPIIHRVIGIKNNGSGKAYMTKGDHNRAPISDDSLDEQNIPETAVIGKSLLRIPLLGYIKIWFVELLRLVGAT
ncbi:signal peptidase I [Candidatus Woesearchaeota archaeon]|nr:signal peptidase I [Candidatus Woesearchaeota archaeon]